MIQTTRFALAVAVAAFCIGDAHGAPQRQPGLFDQWDRNGDGGLTREELPERARLNFDRVDVDGDGTISREEHNAFLQRRRPADKQPAKPSARPVPEGVRRQVDVPYAGTENVRQRVDLYLPEQPPGDGPLPVVVWIHGGAWRGGDKRSGQGQLARLVATGDYAGVSVGYRLTGEQIWPAQIHDCKAAIRWIRAHAAKHNLDPSRIGV
ncbi:MAG: alpha/beta hydrolase fold domain-containing protein, partial [Planctomycetota bacterium]